jgi:hypothetical protein
VVVIQFSYRNLLLGFIIDQDSIGHFVIEVYMLYTLYKNCAPTFSVAPPAARFNPLLEGLFVRSWDSFITETNAHERALRLQEFTEFSLKETSTQTTTMDLEETATVPPKQKKT